MLSGFYHIVIIIVAVWAIFTGYRKGLLRQIGAILGVAFGIVATRTLAPGFLEFVDNWIPPIFGGFNRIYLVETLTCGIIYLVVSGAVQGCTFILGKLIGVIHLGVLGSISGALFRLFQFLMILSIVYNLIVDFKPEGDLTRSSRQHDGNVVEGVMKIAPIILGFPDGEEVGFRHQLEEAKKIS